MSELTLALIALFTSLALLTGAVTSTLLTRFMPGRRRLLEMSRNQATVGIFTPGPRLAEMPSPLARSRA